MKAKPIVEWVFTRKHQHVQSEAVTVLESDIVDYFQMLREAMCAVLDFTGPHSFTDVVSEECSIKYTVEKC